MKLEGKSLLSIRLKLLKHLSYHRKTRNDLMAVSNRKKKPSSDKEIFILLGWHNFHNIAQLNSSILFV